MVVFDLRTIFSCWFEARSLITKTMLFRSSLSVRCALALQTSAKDTLEAGQSDVTARCCVADKVIREVWDEVEYSLRELEFLTLRCRG